MDILNTILLLIAIAIFTTSVILEHQVKSLNRNLLKARHDNEYQNQEIMTVLYDNLSSAREQNNLILDAIESGAEIKITRK